MLTQALCDLLNEALKLDPTALTCLMNLRVPVNKGITDHPNIVVDDSFGGDTLSPLGLLQGIAGAEGLRLYKEIKDGSCEIINFGAEPLTPEINPGPSNADNVLTRGEA